MKQKKSIGYIIKHIWQSNIGKTKYICNRYLTFFYINIQIHWYFFTDVEHLHWVQTLKDAHMVIDASLQWECKAIGKPRPSYKWLKNGQPLTAEVRYRK